MTIDEADHLNTEIAKAGGRLVEFSDEAERRWKRG